MKSARRTLVPMLMAVALIVLGGGDRATRPLLLWNATASAPIGLYAVQPDPRPTVGDLVIVRPDPVLAGWLVERRYIGRDVPLVKRVAAIHGARICRSGVRISIDGRSAAMALARDHLGRTLPTWRGCRQLQADQLFLLNAVPTSLDSRYFGPSASSAVFGRAVPIWLQARR